MRRDAHNVGRMTMVIEVQGMRRREMPRVRWIDSAWDGIS